MKLPSIIARESHVKTRHSYAKTLETQRDDCPYLVWKKKQFESDKKVLQTLDESKTRGLAEGCILDSAHDSCIFSAPSPFVSLFLLPPPR